LAAITKTLNIFGGFGTDYESTDCVAKLRRKVNVAMGRR
jgi:hypothetical protein